MGLRYFLLIIFAFLLLALPVHADSPTMSITFIDVGQGGAAWIHLPTGDDMLIDGGKESYGPEVISYLTSHNVTDIDYMILSHPHADHVGGLVTVLQTIRRAGDPHPAGVVVLLAGAASPLEVVPDQRVAIPLDQVAGAVVDVGLVFSELCGC